MRKMSEEEFAALYEKGNFLGDGASSTVVLGKLRATNEEVAIKTVPSALLVTHRSLFRECAILQKIRHPNIVGIVASILTDSNLYIVMEFVPGLSLFDHILQVRKYTGRVMCWWFVSLLFHPLVCRQRATLATPSSACWAR